VSSKILLRRDILANWQSANPILFSGEPSVVTDTSPPRLKIGDGVTAWNLLPYFSGGAITIQSIGAPLLFDSTTGILTINVAAITDCGNF